MEFQDIIHEDLINCRSLEGMVKSKKIRIFGKAINHDHDDRFIAIFW